MEKELRDIRKAIRFLAGELDRINRNVTPLETARTVSDITEELLDY